MPSQIYDFEGWKFLKSRFATISLRICTVFLWRIKIRKRLHIFSTDDKKNSWNRWSIKIRRQFHICSTQDEKKTREIIGIQKLEFNFYFLCQIVSLKKSIVLRKKWHRLHRQKIIERTWMWQNWFLAIMRLLFLVDWMTLSLSFMGQRTPLMKVGFGMWKSMYMKVTHTYR